MSHARAERPQADTPHSAADLYLRTLKAQGIDYFFANAGTDFPPIVEALARASAEGTPVPRPILVPHENAAVAMAHGVYMVSGRPQVVMVHVNVGTGNTLNTLLNASRDRVPLLLTAGRSPITEAGMHGARNRFIHWAQEMFDQAGMVREAVKWDYELRVPDQAGDVVARALEVAMTSPRGPVYLTLPREVLAAPAVGDAPAPRPRPEPAHPSPAAIEQLADWIVAAERPLVVTADAGRTPDGAAALERLAEQCALPVIAFNPRYVCLPFASPMFQGYQPRPLLSEADLVIVLECDVPWIPSIEGPPPGCRVAHIGEDPGYLRYPMRSFPSDLAITSSAATAADALRVALVARGQDRDPKTAARRQRLTTRAQALHTGWDAAAEKGATSAAISPEFLSRTIHAAIGDDAIVVNEYPLRLEQCGFTRPGSYFGLSPAGGLGWGMGAALGAKLAAPDRLVVATLGDGAYVFANPTACHWVAAAHDLPILTIVFNNQLYGAVRNSTLSMYASGTASRDGGRMLADLRPSPDFERLVEASGGYGARVDSPADLPGALDRAVKIVTQEKRQALLNVICNY